MSQIKSPIANDSLESDPGVQTPAPTSWQLHPDITARKVQQFLLNRITRNRPIILYHYITGKCDCNCPYCTYVNGTNMDLDTVKLLSLYEQAKGLGYIATILTGGEVFMRKDLPLILKYIKSLDYKITLMTNGNYLEDRWLEVKDFIDLLIVSVDWPDDDLDKIRSLPGSFQKIVNGLDFVKKTSQLPILINSILWQKNHDQIHDLAMFAQDMEVKVNFYPMDSLRQFRPGSVESREKFALNYDQLSDQFQLIKELKAQNFPIFNSDGYINFYINKKPAFNCYFLSLFTQVMTNGDVINCSNWEQPIGNIARNTFRQIINSTVAAKARKKAILCNNCNRQEVIEGYLAQKWHWPAMMNMMKLF